VMTLGLCVTQLIIGIAYLNEADLATIRSSGDEGCYVVDETYEGNNGFQVCYILTQGIVLLI
jgi:hypothetical protein